MDRPAKDERQQVGSAETVLIPMLGIITIMLLVGGGLVVFELALWSHKGVRQRMTLRVTPADRAEALLRDILDQREYQQLTLHGYLDVKSPTHARRIYRIPACVGLVRMYEDGIAARELCIQPVEPLPSADVVVMHKLMIEGAEQEYLARARQIATMRPNLRYRP